MKERLVIISDLWGEQKASWLQNYVALLSETFELVFYDSCVLGNVSTEVFEEEALHRQFVQGGVDAAVASLIKKETKPVKILAFSIGGLIAWKYGLQTGNISHLVCVSSTRLRMEKKRPKGEIQLYFGENDPYQPTSEWMNTLDVASYSVPNKAHTMYSDPAFIKMLCEILLKNIGDA